MVNAIPSQDVLVPSTKCEGLLYPTHLWKSVGSVIRVNRTIYSKSIKKNRKKVPFLRVYHLSFSHYFPIVKV